MLYSVASHKSQYGAGALHAGYLRLQENTETIHIKIIAFPQQWRLSERTKILIYNCIAFPVVRYK